jgi:hypothetical protein
MKPRALIGPDELELTLYPIDYGDGRVGVLIQGRNPDRPQGRPLLSLELPSLTDAYELRNALGGAHVAAHALRASRVQAVA